MIAARHSSGHGPFQTRWMPLRSSLKNASFLVRLTAGNATEDLLFVHTDCPCCLGSFQSLPNRNATDDCLRWISLVNNRTRKTRDGIDLVVGVVRRSKHNNETKEEPDAEAEARTCDDVSYGATYVPHEIIYLCYPSYLIESRKSKATMVSFGFGLRTIYLLLLLVVLSTLTSAYCLGQRVMDPTRTESIVHIRILPIHLGKEKEGNKDVRSSCSEAWLLVSRDLDKSVCF